jgi:hypothetical protein
VPGQDARFWLFQPPALGLLAPASIRMILLNPRIAGLSAYHGEIVGQGEWSRW